MNDSTVKTFVKAIKAEKKEPSPYDTTAKVTRVDGNIAWVHISGGVDETPVKMTVDAKVGDEVQVRVGGGKAWITGNATAPPTDDTAALAAKVDSLVAQDQAEKANKKAVDAEAVAQNALNASREVAQYFWFNSTEVTDEGTGAHVTEISQQDFVSDPANGGGNVLVRSDGINIRDGVTNLASFGATAILGSEGGARTEIGSSLISMVTEDDLMAFSVVPVDTVSAQQTVKKSIFDVIERGETKTFTYSFLSTAVASTKISVSCQFSTSSTTSGIGFTFTQGTAETKTSASGIPCTYNGSTGFTLTLPANSAYTYGSIVSISYVIQTNKSTEVRVYGDLFIQDINLTSILSSPTLITTGISGYNTRADISSGGYLDVGKWRYVQMNVELNQELSANNYYAILQGFAIPSINTSMAAAVNSKNGGAVSAYINSSGNLIIETGTTKLYAQEHVTISGWYIKA